MSIFDDLKKKNDKEEKSYGWDAITNEFDKIYPNQKNPKHYGI